LAKEGFIRRTAAVLRLSHSQSAISRSTLHRLHNRLGTTAQSPQCRRFHPYRKVQTLGVGQLSRFCRQAPSAGVRILPENRLRQSLRQKALLVRHPRSQPTERSEMSEKAVVSLPDTPCATPPNPRDANAMGVYRRVGATVGEGEYADERGIRRGRKSRPEPTPAPLPNPPLIPILVNHDSRTYVTSTSELEIMIAMDLTLAATAPLVPLQDVLCHARIHHPVQSVLVDA